MNYIKGAVTIAQYAVGIAVVVGYIVVEQARKVAWS